jgi:hypothetical protein
VREDLPALGEYLNARLLPFKIIPKGALKEIHKDHEYQVHSIQQWPDINKFREEALESGSKNIENTL